MISLLKSRRSWLRPRLSTVLYMIVAVGLVLAWPQVRRQSAFLQLNGYVGVNLLELPAEERQQVNEWIELVVDASEEDQFYWFNRYNRLLHRSKAPTAKGQFFVIQIQRVFSPKDGDLYHMYVLSRWGCLVRKHTFRICGFGQWVENIAFCESRYGFMCLVVETSGSRPGEIRQFYRISDTHVELIRVEWRDGTTAMGTLRGNGFESADKPADWADWQGLIASDDVVDQLRGLASFWSYDNLRPGRTVNESMRGRLEELSKSEDPWISEEAAAAVELLDMRRKSPRWFPRGESRTPSPAVTNPDKKDGRNE